MKITYLGSGNAFAPRRLWGSILINDSILLDAGPSVLLACKQLGVSPAQIRHLMISHFHGDHYFGTPFLLLDNYFVSPTDEPLTIIGPAGVEERLRQLMAMAYEDLLERGWPRPITFVEAQPYETQTANGLTFTPIPMAHAGDSLAAYGYRVHLDDGVLAYSGDTRMTDALYTLLEGARAGIVEADSHEESSSHLGLKDLRHLLATLPSDVHLLLNHLDTADGAAWAGLRVTVPEDLQTYELI